MSYFSLVTPEQWKRLEALVASAFIRHKDGETAIFFDPDYVMHWSILLSNDCRHVSLGESSGRYQGNGETFEQALTELEKAFNDPQR